MHPEHREGSTSAGRNNRVFPGRATTLVALLLGAALVAIAGVMLYAGERDKAERARAVPAAPPPESAERRLVPPSNKPIGDPTAGVKVIAVLPVSVGCKDHLSLYLASVSRKFPSKISLVVFDMKSEQGRQAMEEHGLRCAAILINGKSKFDFGGDDKVLLEGLDLDDTGDLRRALAAELKRVYGDSAPELPPLPAAE